MYQPIITVVIPVYNTEVYLDKCLSSVINQCFSNIQIVIVNDGSTDNSLEICKKYAASDKRITLINKVNEGVSVARNIGIELAEGKWILFLDSDDYLDDGAFSYLLDLLITDEDVIMFGSRAVLENKVISQNYPIKEFVTDDFKFFLNNIAFKPLSACFALLSKKNIINNKIKFNIDMKHNEDILFMYKVYSVSKNIIVTKSILYNQVLSPNSVTRSPLSIKVLEDNLKLVDYLCDYSRTQKINSILGLHINNCLKYFFVNVFNMRLNNHEYKYLQKKYNFIYKKNKDIINSGFSFLGFINIKLVYAILFLKKLFVYKI